jgi:GLPGLI family protein
MKRKLLFGICLVLSIGRGAYAQKVISEGTITYNIAIQNNKKEAQQAGGFNNATTTIILKGGLSRTDMVSTLGNETTIHDSKNGTAVILKEYSGQKLMITLTKENWIAKNKRSAGINFETAVETRVIEGYTCNKATAKLSDGSAIMVYYANSVNAFNKEYDPLFKNLPGLPVQYEFEKNNLRFIYTLNKVDLNAVAVSRFDTPKSGYRVMTYDESQQGKKESQ